MNRYKKSQHDFSDYFVELDRAFLSSDSGFTFTADCFPRLPALMTSLAIQMRKSYHFIDDCWRVDVVNFKTDKMVYRHLAFSILAVVFCQDLPQLEIRLLSESDIKTIRISYPGKTPRAVFNYLTVPHSFEYHPTELDENPWTGKFPQRALPDFKLQYSGARDWEHWDNRDLLVGFGNDDTSVRLADMLLNLSRPSNSRNLVRLETGAGYGGVSKLSAEARFHLPESTSWPVTIKTRADE